MEEGNFDKQISEFKKILANKKEDYGEKAAVIHELRVNLCQENPHIKPVLDADIIPSLIAVGKAPKAEETLIEIVWILSNLAFGDHEDVSLLLKKNVHRFLIEALNSHQTDEIFYNVLWGFANMAYDGPETRDVLLKLNVLSQILAVFEKLKTTLSESTRNRLAWTVCAFNDLSPPPEYSHTKGTAKYLSYSLGQEKDPDTVHYLLKTVALILRTLRKEAVADLQAEGVLSQIQKNFLAVKKGSNGEFSEYIYCFSYFISDHLRVPELVDILSEDKTFEALAGLLSRRNLIVGLLAQIIEEKDKGAEELLKHNPETLNILSSLIGETTTLSNYQDAIRLLGNLLHFGSNDTRRAVLSKFAEKTIMSKIVKSILNLKDPIIQSLLQGIAEAAKALKSEKNSSQHFNVIKEAVLDSDSLVWKYIVLKKDPKFNQLLDVLKTELHIQEEHISKGSKHLKPGYKKMGTMAQVVEEGNKFLQGAEFDSSAKKTRGRKGTEQPVEATSKKKGSKKGGKGKPEETKKAETPKGKAGKSASKSKGKKASDALEEEKTETKTRKKIIPTTRAIKRTKTMIETLKQSEQILAEFEEGPRSGRKGSAKKQQNQQKQQPPQPQEEEKQPASGRGKRGQKKAEPVEEKKDVVVEEHGRGKRRGKEVSKEQAPKEEPAPSKRTKKK